MITFLWGLFSALWLIDACAWWRLHNTPMTVVGGTIFMACSYVFQIRLKRPRKP